MTFLFSFLLTCLRLGLPVLMLLLVGTLTVSAEGPEGFVGLPIPSNPLATLKPEHPRLLATAADFARLKLAIQTDELAARMAKAVLRQADSILTQPLPEHVLPDGKRLLSTSRKVKDHMQTLGLAWQLTGDRKYPERAWKDLEAAGNFPDWNPPHFLDTAEMTRAFAIGLDWMHVAWTPEQREQICQWILRLGLSPALEIYRMPKGGPLRQLNNWGQVTNGGIGMGALAIADSHPDEAREVLRHALECIQPSLARFAPDGGWDEGYGYFIYALEYSTGLLSSTEAALGTDFGLFQISGLASTPDFSTYLEGNSGYFFGFADCGEGEMKIKAIPSVAWVATRSGNAWAAARERGKADLYPSALGLLWLPPASGPSTLAEPSRVKAFAANACCTLRTAWNNSDAAFVGFKAGNNRISHGHLDIGTFVYDVQGAHWAVDLGADNYNLPGYFGKQRWNYYRLRAEGHNTLVVDPDSGPDQSPSANCLLTLCADRGNACIAVGDLGAAYPGLLSAKRGLLLNKDGRLRIQDELEVGPKQALIFWFMHTPAKVVISEDGKSAVLTQGGKRLRAALLSPKSGRFETFNTVPLPSSPNPPGQKLNQGITKLALRLNCTHRETVVVDLIPDGASPVLAPISELAGW